MSNKKTLPVVSQTTTEKSPQVEPVKETSTLPLPKEAQLSNFKSSTCKDCLFWYACGDNVYGYCRKEIPSVKTSQIKTEGSIHIYPLTEASLPACSNFQQN